MEVLLGGVAGLVTGVLGALVVSVLQITGKRARNARLVRRGEPPVKDVILTPLPWMSLFGVLGFIAGVSWTWRLAGTWTTGAVAGAGCPALVALGFVGWMAAQWRR